MIRHIVSIVARRSRAEREAAALLAEQHYWARQWLDRGLTGLAWAMLCERHVHRRFVVSPIPMTLGANNSSWGSYLIMNRAALLDRIAESPIASAILRAGL